MKIHTLPANVPSWINKAHEFLICILHVILRCIEKYFPSKARISLQGSSERQESGLTVTLV